MRISATQRKISRLRKQAQHAAKVRWQRDAERRERLAALDPVFTGSQIARRIIVIDDESRVRETVIYRSDSRRDWIRKLKSAMRPVK